MVTISRLFGDFLFLGFLLMFVSWFLWIAEAMGIRNLSPWWYGVGPKVLHVEIPRLDGRPLTAFLSSKGETSSVSYALIDETACLFRASFSFFSLRISRGLVVKGHLRSRSGVVRAEGRLPLAPCLGVAGWVLIFLAVGLGGDDPTEAWPMALAGLALPALLFPLFVLSERHQVKKALFHLMEIIDPDPSGGRH